MIEVLDKFVHGASRQSQCLENREIRFNVKQKSGLLPTSASNTKRTFKVGRFFSTKGIKSRNWYLARPMPKNSMNSLSAIRNSRQKKRPRIRSTSWIPYIRIKTRSPCFSKLKHNIFRPIRFTLFVKILVTTGLDSCPSI